MRIVPFIALAVALVVEPHPVHAAQDRADDIAWARVASLPPGTAIVLTLKGTSPLERSLMSADQRGLTVLNGSDVEVVARTDVAQISALRTKHSRSRVALWTSGGFFAGALAAGFIVGVASN